MTGPQHHGAHTGVRVGTKEAKKVGFLLFPAVCALCTTPLFIMSLVSPPGEEKHSFCQLREIITITIISEART